MIKSGSSALNSKNTVGQGIGGTGGISGDKISQYVIDKKNGNVKRINKRYYILLPIIISVAVLIVLFGCFVALYFEVGQLKSELSSFKKSNTLHINNIIRNLQSIEDKFEDITDVQASKVQQLNVSVRRIEDILEGFNDLQANDSDMTRSCGGITRGWRRVAELDMADSNHQCPSGFRQRNDSNKRTCGITSTGCISVNFSVATLEYSKVCGKIRAYQYGLPDAFADSSIDGVSITHGSPRQHIWTFVAAHSELGSAPGDNCPCTNTNTSSQASQPPAFVGNDYFCDTGNSGTATRDFFGDDPLWDGAGCGPLNMCCSFNNPPWFYKQLPQPTTSDVEMTACRTSDDEDIAIETVQIYVQ